MIVGAFDVCAKDINEEMKIAASFDPRVKDTISKAVAQTASDSGVAGI